MLWRTACDHKQTVAGTKMSIAGVRSNRGDSYQTVIAIEWVVEMLLDEKIASIEVDTTEMVGNRPASVDDIVVRYSDGHSTYIQCKKNQTDFKDWSAKDLGAEFMKAAALLQGEPKADVVFCSRSSFGSVAKLREHAQTQPNYRAFRASLTADHKSEHTHLCDCLGGIEKSPRKTFDFLLRMQFETTTTVERITERNKATLARHITNHLAAHNAIWAATDQLGARIARPDGGVHELTRTQLLVILETNSCEALPNALVGLKPFVATDRQPPSLAAARLVFAEQFDAKKAVADSSQENWRERYESLVAKLEAQAPESAMHRAGQALVKENYAVAATELDGAIESARKNLTLLAAAYHSRGELHLLQSQENDALASFKLACHHDSKNVDYITDYSNLLVGLKSFKEAKKVLTDAIEQVPDEAVNAIWHCGLGAALLGLDDFDGALCAFANSERLFASRSTLSERERASLANGLYINRGVIYENMGRYSDALHCYQSAVEYFREATQTEPSSDLQCSLGEALNNLALLTTNFQTGEDAGRLYEEAQGLLSDADNWRARRSLAMVLVNRADYLLARDQFANAESLLEKSLRIRKETLYQSGWHASASLDVCDCLLTLANLRHRQGENSQALSLVGEVRAQADLLRAREGVAYGILIYRFLPNATAIYRSSGRFDDAIECADEAIRFLRKQRRTPDINETLAIVLNNKANVLIETRDMQKAGETHAEALAIRAELAKNGTHQHLCDLALSLSAVGALLTDSKLAKEYRARATAILSKLAETYPQLYLPRWAAFLTNECLNYCHLKDYEKAISCGKLSVDVIRKLYFKSSNGAYERDLASALLNLAIAYEADGHLNSAISSIIESREILIRSSVSGDARTILYLVKAYENLCHIHLARGDQTAAFEAGNRGLELITEHRERLDQSFSDDMNRASERIQELLC
jgi:tetratricopeptide (TPR) repeat protein